jgi:hypothetical protein
MGSISPSNWNTVDTGWRKAKSLGFGLKTVENDFWESFYTLSTTSRTIFVVEFSKAAFFQALQRQLRKRRP